MKECGNYLQYLQNIQKATQKAYLQVDCSFEVFIHFVIFWLIIFCNF